MAEAAASCKFGEDGEEDIDIDAANIDAGSVYACRSAVRQERVSRPCIVVVDHVIY